MSHRSKATYLDRQSLWLNKVLPEKLTYLNIHFMNLISLGEAECRH